jgi:hypothetical protein
MCTAAFLELLTLCTELKTLALLTLQTNSVALGRHGMRLNPPNAWRIAIADRLPPADAFACRQPRHLRTSCEPTSLTSIQCYQYSMNVTSRIYEALMIKGTPVPQPPRRHHSSFSKLFFSHPVRYEALKVI